MSDHTSWSPSASHCVYLHRFLMIHCGCCLAAGTRTGGGNRMSSLMNFYTDDSPGLKISPVGAMAISGVIQMSWGAAGCRLWEFASTALTLHPLLCCMQVAVIVMSLGYIFFVTVLHIIGKVGG